MSTNNAVVQAPPGFKLRYTLRGHRNRVYMLAWSPDGQMLASPSGDRLIHIWDLTTGVVAHTLRFRAVRSAAWSPNGKMFASVGRRKEYSDKIQLWDTSTFELQKEIGNSKHLWFGEMAGFAWSPNNRTIVIWGYSGDTPQLIDIEAEGVFSELEFSKINQYDFICNGSWSPDGRRLALVSQRVIRVWSIESEELLYSIEGSFNWQSHIAWSPDGTILAFGGSYNETITIWNSLDGSLLSVIEGRTNVVHQISFSSDGRLLIAKSAGGTIQIWRCDNWQLVTEFKNLDFNSWMAINPCDLGFAILGENDRAIHIWDIDTESLLSIPSATESVRYRNAKVVLIGDSGIGKSGLGMVLAGEEFKATKSTHGRHVWNLEAKHHKVSDDLWESRETLLWDLAGQAEYRLVHQLSLDQVNVALVLFDGSSPTDPFKGVTFWNKALQQAKGSKHLIKYLVAARTDVSSLNVTEVRMNDFASEYGFHGAFRTSAFTGSGVEELRQQIETAIDWDRLPLTISENLFKRMKNFIVERKQRGYVLETITDLIQYFRLANLEVSFEDQDFQAAIGRVEAHDLVKALSFGEYILLQPEFLDNYASAMARAAREQPDGLGFLSEQAAREGQFNFGSLDRVLEDEEQIILQSVVELFIEKELAITDEGRLIFPSQFNRELPEHPEVKGTVVSYQFEGALLNAYTTLVVRLYHSEAFVKQSLWKNAAIFLPFGLKGQNKQCGFVFKESDQGIGRIAVFFGVDVPDETKILFLKYIHEHLKRKALNSNVMRERIYRCPKCQQEVIDRRAVQFRLEQGLCSIPCLYCSMSTDILLSDLIEETFGRDDDFLAKVRQMDEQINTQLDNDSKDAILKGEFMVLVGKAGQIFRPTPSDDWGIDGEIEFKTAQGKASGQRIYVQLKSGASYLKRRKDGTQVFHIPKKRHIEYWQSHQYPVYLVIRDENEKILWMNISQYLATRTDKESHTVIFHGEDVTVETVKALQRVRLNLF